jgi:hypothetical protein
MESAKPVAVIAIQIQMIHSTVACRMIAQAIDKFFRQLESVVAVPIILIQTLTIPNA